MDFSNSTWESRNIICSDLVTNFQDLLDPVANFQDLREPVVYTTKLDDMTIFKSDLRTKTTGNIVESIINESKPKLNLKRKRQIELKPNLLSHDKLLHDLSIYNNMVSTRRQTMKLLLAKCTPVKVMVQDLKYQVPARRPYSPKVTCRIIYDVQHKEADMYFLDQDLCVVKYIRWQTGDNKNRAKTILKLENDVNQTEEVFCCCWYKRENYIKLLTNYPRQTLKFMQKPHKCDVNLCHCCCRKNYQLPIQPLERDNIFDPKPSGNYITWLKEFTEKYKSPPKQQTAEKTLIADINTRNRYLKSTNIQINEKYYGIGPKGQINLFVKDTGKNISFSYYHNFLTNRNVIDNICCWYSRERLSVNLLQHGALPETVNFIRNSHQCPLTSCTCCCKPVNKTKPKIKLLPIVTRHTNDVASKNINVNYKFSEFSSTIPEVSVIPFSISFSENSMSQNVTLSNPKLVQNILDSFGKIQFCLKGAIRIHQVQAYAQVDINDLSKTELKLLDHSFCIIREQMTKKEKQNKPSTKSNNNNEKQNKSSNINNKSNNEPRLQTDLQIEDQNSRKMDKNIFFNFDVQTKIREQFNSFENENDTLLIPTKKKILPLPSSSKLCPVLIPNQNNKTELELKLVQLGQGFAKGEKSSVTTKQTKTKNNKKDTSNANRYSIFCSKLTDIAEHKNKIYIESFQKYTRKFNLPDLKNVFDDCID